MRPWARRTTMRRRVRVAGKAPKSAPSLLPFLGVIAAGETAKALKLLAATPELACKTLEAGATRTNSKDSFFERILHYAYAGDTALHLAAAAYEPDIVKALLAHGARVDARNRRGAEPLHYASDGHPDAPGWDPKAQAATIAALLKAGANPNALDRSGVAPLHRAIRNRCSAAVRALLKGGADAQLPNQSGSTPLQLAEKQTGRGGSGSAASKQQQQLIIELLAQSR